MKLISWDFEVSPWISRHWIHMLSCLNIWWPSEVKDQLAAHNWQNCDKMNHNQSRIVKVIRSCSLMNQYTHFLFSHQCSRERKICHAWVIPHNTNLFPDRTDANSNCLPSQSTAKWLCTFLVAWATYSPKCSQLVTGTTSKCNLSSHRTHPNLWQDFIPDAVLKPILY